MKHSAVTFAAMIAVFGLAPLARTQQTLNLSGMRFWLERADAIRGPEAFGEDNYYTSYQISAGSFRNFTSNACWNTSDGPNCTQAMNGTAPWDATAAPTTGQPGNPIPPSGPYYDDVLGSKTPNANKTNLATWAPCGQWLNSVIVSGGHLYGFVHGEAPDSVLTPSGSCSAFKTHHKTMTLWTSVTGSSAGLQNSWLTPTRIIDSQSGVGQGGESGEGDCNAVQVSSDAYLFCRNPSGDLTEVARAPLTDLTHFIKYDSGWGSEPGVNGTSSTLTSYYASGPNANQATTVIGTGASVWADNSMAMLLGVSDSKFQGLKASFMTLPSLQSSSIQVTSLPIPFFVQEAVGGGYPYGGKPTVDLYIYPSVVNLLDGTRTWNLTQKSQFLLAYTFVPPYNDLVHRILATRSVTVTKSSTTQDPQVAVALTTRYDTNFKQYYSSTQPVEYGSDTTKSYASGSFSQITVDTVGYVPQLNAGNTISQGQSMTKLVECTSMVNWPQGHPDHLVTTNACDNVNTTYHEDTVAGYTYPSKPASGNSVQIYRCSAANGTHFVSSSNTCGGSGTMEKSLGWIVSK